MITNNELGRFIEKVIMAYLVTGLLSQGNVLSDREK
jgi:hypothetical protein